MKQTDFAKSLTHYLGVYLPGQRNVSSNTIKSYRDTFKQLIQYFEVEMNIQPHHLSFNKINTQNIKDFLHWLEIKNCISINTRNQRLAAIHSFYRYLQSEQPEYIFECQRMMSIPFKKREIKPINYLTEEGLKLVLNQPNTNTKKGRRDLLLMVLLYDTGARVQELIDLTIEDIRLSQPTTITLTGKGRKKRHVPIMGKTTALLKNYVNEHNLIENGKNKHPIFFNSRREKFTRPGITYILEKYLRMAKTAEKSILLPDKLTPHMMRHTKAIHLLDAGVNLIYIRDLLGHVSVTTTEHCAKVNSETKRKVLESAYIEVVKQDIPLWTEDQNLLTWLTDFCK